MTERICPGIKADGMPCGAHPRKGNIYCPWHDPEKREEVIEQKRRGGQNRSREARARKLLQRGMTDLGDVRSAMLEAFDMVRNGKLDPEIGKAMANMARAIKDISLVSQLEIEMKEIREQLNEGKISNIA